MKALIGASGGALLIVAFAAYWLWCVDTAQAAESCGRASFYSEAHQGKPMANGRPFNMYAMTAASWDYPLGSMVSVMNVANGRTVIVTITDRGPARRLHRVIDLSKAAFAKLARTEQGLIKRVCLKRL